MSEPVSHPNDPAATPGGGIPEEPMAAASHEDKQAPNAGFEPGVAIAAEPISILRPGEEAPRSTPRRRNQEEMSKRPTWLPEDWKLDLRVRSSGATAGLIDRYFIEPTGQRRFRSKIEVVHFLETGSKIKRKATSEANDAPLESPLSSPKKARKKGKKAKDLPNGDGAKVEVEAEAEAKVEVEAEAKVEVEVEAEAEAEAGK